MMKKNYILFLLVFYSMTSNGQGQEELRKDSLTIIICKMLSEDQRVRTEHISNKLKREIDSINFVQLTAITKKFGYPNKKKIGDTSCDTPFQILMHNPDRIIQKENYELYINECKKGNIDGWELGLALDRYYTQFLKKSMYGLYPQALPCIEDFDIVNKNRRDLNLKELDRSKFNECR